MSEKTLPPFPLNDGKMHRVEYHITTRCWVDNVEVQMPPADVFKIHTSFPSDLAADRAADQGSADSPNKHF